ncbi:hypothetical protein [Spirosoma harenae]
MKKQPEKQPIDDLFARKLGNMSLPPRGGGFERLQAKMGQGKPEAKMVFWRNPEIQRYMAAAACLVLVCLFGWLYWPSGMTTDQKGAEVAVNKNPKSQPKESNIDPVKSPSTKANPNTVMPIEANEPMMEKQLAKVDQAPANSSHHNHTSTSSITTPAPKSIVQPAPSVDHEPVLAQVKPEETASQNKSEGITPVAPIAQTTPEWVAENKTTVKPAPVTERGLVVTIAEPESLVAAQQAAKSAVEEKTAVSVNDTPEKAGSLWQRVKRFKQGEQFARHDNPANEDRGLLSRAYSGLKQSLDKDKSTKQ